MRRQDFNVLLLKPLGAVGFVGVLVAALDVRRLGFIPGTNAAWESTLWHLFWATLCLSICLLSGRGRNAAANHGGAGILAGLALGFVVAGESAFRALLNGEKSPGLVQTLVDILLVSLPGALVGAGFGLGIGLVRGQIARWLGKLSKTGAAGAQAPARYELGAGAFVGPRAVQVAVVASGLGVILAPFVGPGRRLASPPPKIHTLDREELLRWADASRPTPAKTNRSAQRIWQADGVQTLAFSPDGKYLATGGNGQSIGVWNTADWTHAGHVDSGGSAAQLAFSPDGQWLYVAGNAGRRPILTRFAWRTGQRDRVFEGHSRPVDALALSPDGQTLISSSEAEHVLRFWDTTTGTSGRDLPVPGGRFAYAWRRDFVLAWEQRGDYVNAYLAGQWLAQLPPGGKVLAAAITANEEFLVLARRYGSTPKDYEISLGVHRLGDLRLDSPQTGAGWVWQDRTAALRQAMIETRLPGARDSQAALAISPDGSQVALAPGGLRLRLYALPGLDLIKDLRFSGPRTGPQPITQLAYSPAGRWLVAAQAQRTTPRLIDAASGEERTIGEGHGDALVDLRFSAEGRTLQSIGRDGTFCLWDATSLKLIRRITLPPDRQLVDLRPWDGRYAFCPHAVEPQRPVAIIDVTTGRTVCEVALPVTADASDAAPEMARLSRVYWLNAREALCTGYDRAMHERRWWRFNYRTGKVLAEGSITGSRGSQLPNTQAAVTEDGKYVFFLNGGGKGTPPSRAGRIHLGTLLVTDLGRIDRPVHGKFGLVPGGRYFHVGLHIYDRQTLRLVSATEMPKVPASFRDRSFWGCVTFSPDGSRWAADLRLQDSDEHWTPVVFVGEPLTGRVLWAFRPAATVDKMCFSPDGRQLALAYADGILESHVLANDP